MTFKFTIPSNMDELLKFVDNRKKKYYNTKEGYTLLNHRGELNFIFVMEIFESV